MQMESQIHALAHELMATPIHLPTEDGCNLRRCLDIRNPKVMECIAAGFTFTQLIWPSMINRDPSDS